MTAKKEKAAPVEKKIEKTAPIEKVDELVFKAALSVGQVLKQMILLDVKAPGGPVLLNASRLSFDRSLLPDDYDFSEGREYSLVIKRTK